MGRLAPNFSVGFSFLGLSDTGLLGFFFGLFCFSSCLISFWSCAISLSSCLIFWSGVCFGFVICVAFFLVDHVDAG